MLLDLKQIIQRPGEALPFEFDLDLSDLEFYGICPIAEPVHVTGEVKNHAGLLVLSGTAETVLHVNCDRCGKPFLKPMSVSYTHLRCTMRERARSTPVPVCRWSWCIRRPVRTNPPRCV